MKKKTLDSLDNEIIRLLTEDGRMPIGDMAARLNVTAPTIRSRINNLEESGLLKISALVDTSQHQELITALVGLNVRSHGKLDQILEKISRLENVTWAAVVTGRYDIFAEVVVTGGTEDLYRFTSEIIPKVGTVLKSETFVIIKSGQKWVRLPKAVEEI
jgi:Lrp/AsnC family transcriptional regulator for asnA, asnC and gidA